MNNINCHICNKDIQDLEGFIFADFHKSIIDDLLHNYSNDKALLLSSPQGDYVDAIVIQYLRQYDVPIKKRKGPFKLSEYMEKKKESGNRYKRFDMVYDNLEDDDCFFIISHSQCLPKDYNPLYYISLDRINKPIKAIDWSRQLSEKTWFCYKSWIKILEEMFL